MCNNAMLVLVINAFAHNVFCINIITIFIHTNKVMDQRVGKVSSNIEELEESGTGEFEGGDTEESESSIEEFEGRDAKESKDNSNTIYNYTSYNMKYNLG
ncbi:hypothetical protein RhiirC2_791458 [Rhizophagus irregularis]|uniref:Uncharacterized protein n=1 Tax=Rhizophagus irregularis TaxID=588596 RepID=A0A2N1MJ64_9GLOM|nr:hypothetical protein RhiirC2_791458 [Rhizophagus irregularis]